MTTRAILATCAALAIAGIGCGSANGEEATGQTSTSDLALDVAPDGAIGGTIVVDGETISVLSKLVHASTTSGAPAHDVRSTVVSGKGGAVYAEWQMDTTTTDTVGRIDGQHFGAPEDADTDMDAALWANIRASRSGHVLAAIAQPAAELLTSKEYAPAHDAVAELARIAPLLDEMSAAPSAVQSSGGGTCFKYGTYLLVQSVFDGKQYTFSTITDPNFDTGSICAGTYWDQMYTASYSILHSKSAYYSGSGTPPSLAVYDQFTDYGGQSSHCRRGKHWRSGHAAYWSVACN